LSRPESAQSEQPLRDSKVRDRALVLPLVGALLLISPLVGIFQLEFKLAGIPFTLIYLFTVWAFLIAAAAALSRRLRDGVVATGSVELADPRAPELKGDGPQVSAAAIHRTRTR
jgi:hypothetical membrane protein